MAEALDRYLPKIVRGKIVLYAEDDETWLVINDHLKSSALGLSYRSRKSLDLDAQCSNGELVKWGTTVKGVDEGDGWLRVLSLQATPPTPRLSPPTAPRPLGYSDAPPAPPEAPVPLTPPLSLAIQAPQVPPTRSSQPAPPTTIPSGSSVSPPAPPGAPLPPTPPPPGIQAPQIQPLGSSQPGSPVAPPAPLGTPLLPTPPLPPEIWAPQVPLSGLSQPALPSLLVPLAAPAPPGAPIPPLPPLAGPSQPLPPGPPVAPISPLPPPLGSSIVPPLGAPFLPTALPPGVHPPQFGQQDTMEPMNPAPTQSIPSVERLNEELTKALREKEEAEKRAVAAEISVEVRNQVLEECQKLLDEREHELANLRETSENEKKMLKEKYEATRHLYLEASEQLKAMTAAALSTKREEAIDVSEEVPECKSSKKIQESTEVTSSKEHSQKEIVLKDDEKATTTDTPSAVEADIQKKSAELDTLEELPKDRHDDSDSSTSDDTDSYDGQGARRLTPKTAPEKKQTVTLMAKELRNCVDLFEFVKNGSDARLLQQLLQQRITEEESACDNRKGEVAVDKAIDWYSPAVGRFAVNKSAIHRYLPKKIRDQVVVIPEDEETWRVVNDQLKSNSIGLGYRARKSMNTDAQISNRDLVEWGEIVKGVDEGDGWIRVAFLQADKWHTGSEFNEAMQPVVNEVAQEEEEATKWKVVQENLAEEKAAREAAEQKACEEVEQKKLVAHELDETKKKLAEAKARLKLEEAAWKICVEEAAKNTARELEKQQQKLEARPIPDEGELEVGDEIVVMHSQYLHLDNPTNYVAPEGAKGTIVKVTASGGRVVEWHDTEGKWPITSNALWKLQKIKAAATDAQSEPRIADIHAHAHDQIAKEPAARADTKEAAIRQGLLQPVSQLFVRPRSRVRDFLYDALANAHDYEPTQTSGKRRQRPSSARSSRPSSARSSR